MINPSFKLQASGFTLVIFVFIIFSFMGCASISNNAKSAQAVPGLLEPQVTLKFADIPVPVGFKFLAADSYAFESSGVRVAALKYQGKAKPDQVIIFYKEQMPMYNWNLLNVIEFGERLLNFDRDTETCIINLSGKGNAVIITISVGPKPQITRVSQRPVK